MVASGQLSAVENAASEQSPWTTPHRERTRWQERERHQVSGDGGGGSGSATRARRDRGSRSHGTNRVVVEPASVEAIAGDELGRGCIEWSSRAYG
jgi:hypothetical protein